MSLQSHSMPSEQAAVLGTGRKLLRGNISRVRRMGSGVECPVGSSTVPGGKWARVVSAGLESSCRFIYNAVGSM